MDEHLLSICILIHHVCMIHSFVLIYIVYIVIYIVRYNSVRYTVPWYTLYVRGDCALLTLGGRALV